MRGIEGALLVIEETRKGRFASEALRRLKGMEAGDASLASSLVYAALRRQEMWRAVFEMSLKGGPKDGARPERAPRQGRERSKDKSASLPPLVRDCLLLGTAGLLDLHHFAGGVLVNALLDRLKARSMGRWVPLVNAVLRDVGEQGRARAEALRRSPELADRALWAGVPTWSLPAWERSWPRGDLDRLLDLLPQPPASSLRPAPGTREELLGLLRGRGMEADPSDVSGAVRLGTTVAPQDVPGFGRGLCTVQSEGSIIIGELAADLWEGGPILDMCSGRGVKAGQLLQARSDARIEGWELSKARHASAQREMRRLGVADRATLRQGDALQLSPQEPPSLIIVDAPCSGSGTWSRKPDSKWRLDWERLDRLAGIQLALLERAMDICAPRGIMLYVTCSLLRRECENVVAEALSRHPGCVELPPPWSGRPFRRGRPWGTYIWPEGPWLDGFYCAVIMKR